MPVPLTVDDLAMLDFENVLLILLLNNLCLKYSSLIQILDNMYKCRVTTHPVLELLVASKINRVLSTGYNQYFYQTPHVLFQPCNDNPGTYQLIVTLDR